MKPVIIIPIVVIPVIFAAVFAVFFVQSMPQQNFEDSSEETRDEASWQLLQKTYLEQECREQFMGQPDQLEDCYDRIDEEQRLNPPTNPNESDCSIQCFAYDPVCGEDGITYACGVEDAACHGIKVEHKGECAVSTNPPK